MFQDLKLCWPKNSAANMNQTYESIDLLYEVSGTKPSDHRVGMIVSCADVTTSEKKGENCIHKLDITDLPNFSSATPQVTHEVLPGQGTCSQIITVNPGLKIAAFDTGCIIPVKNFGPKNTFNCDVRGRLSHHHNAINALAANHRGDQLASGSVSGELVLYRVDDERISFLSRASIGHYVTGLAYVHESNDTLIYANLEGDLGTIDTRCKLAQEITQTPLVDSQRNISTICSISKKPAMVVAAGCASGQIVGFDLRNPREELFSPTRDDDGCVRRLREVLVSDSAGQTCSFIAYTNQTNELRILETETMFRDKRWICQGLPHEEQRDFVQVGNHLVSCGRKTSIGCWSWDNSREREGS